MITYSMQSVSDISLTPSMASLIFSLILGSIVLFGTRSVDRITTAIIGGMIISFLIFVAGLLEHVEAPVLFPELPMSSTLPYSFAALSFIAVSFGFQNCVPTVTQYLKKDALAIRKSILIGSLIPLIFYILWVTSIFGNISRDLFPDLIASGGNIGSLMVTLENKGLNHGMSNILQLFSNLAIASSFLGVSLSLFDYMADLFGFKMNWAGRLKTAAITFIPPTLFGILLPNGFIHAISFAGFAMVIFSILTPVIMAWVGRKTEMGGYRVPGGKARMLAVLLFGLISLALAMMDALSLLPWFN